MKMWIKLCLCLIAISLLSSCGTRNRNKNKNVAPVETRRTLNQPVQLMRVFPETKNERLVLTASTFPSGIYLCAIENLAKPCLPKLSAWVAAALNERGIVTVSDQAAAEVTIYFETWFDSYASSAEIDRELQKNPAQFGQSFAAKIEESLSTGFLPNVHKHLRNAENPDAFIRANVNDEQKFIYVALTAVNMAMAIDFPGDEARNLAPSKNPWANMSHAKSTWMKAKTSPPKRSLIGNYEGEVPTEKAVMPLLQDALGLLLERVSHPPKKK